MNELYHHGVKGMKWGVRRKQTVSYKGAQYVPNNRYLKPLARFSKNYVSEVNKTYDYSIKVGKKTVGNLSLYQEAPNSTNIAWLNINPKYAGKGYARNAMAFAEKFAKEQGSKQLTAEVVGHTPQINHLVDDFGYVRLNQLSDDDVWGGLTAIRKDL